MRGVREEYGANPSRLTALVPAPIMNSNRDGASFTPNPFGSCGPDGADPPRLQSGAVHRLLSET
jgi:hypothetical protein